MEAPVDLSEEGYRTLLLGMKGDTTYHFRIVANGGADVSEDYTITTGSVPGNVASVDFSAQAGSEPGFIVMGSWQGSSTAFIVDSDGDTVWWYESPAANVGRGRMSADGKNLWVVAATNNGNPLYRVSMDGLDEQTYNGIQGDHDLTAVTHDLTAVTGETMAFLDNGGTCDRTFEITPAGNPTQVFDSTDHVSSGGGALGCHGNSVRYSSAEDVYIFSGRPLFARLARDSSSNRCLRAQAQHRCAGSRPHLLRFLRPCRSSPVVRCVDRWTADSS